MCLGSLGGNSASRGGTHGGQKYSSCALKLPNRSAQAPRVHSLCEGVELHSLPSSPQSHLIHSAIHSSTLRSPKAKMWPLMSCGARGPYLEGKGGGTA